jgi:cyclopropane fatty-acyl-phospholipid synthase-like methyltransferase
MNNKQIEELYDKRCVEKTHSWDAALWQSEDSQYGRFVLAGNYISKDASVFDVGCGQGDFGKYLNSRKITSNYEGIDISQEMVNRAKINYSQANYIKDDYENHTGKIYDHVVAIGSFNLKNDKNQYDYIESNLDRAFNQCKKNVILTLTSNPAQLIIEPEELVFMYSPEVMVQIVSSISPYYIVNTVSLPLEMLIVIYK